MLTYVGNSVHSAHNTKKFVMMHGHMNVKYKFILTTTTNKINNSKQLITIPVHPLYHTKSERNFTVLITAAEGRLGRHLYLFSRLVCKLQFLHYRHTFLYTSFPAINFFKINYIHTQPPKPFYVKYFSVHLISVQFHT
jgi:hypothetical protein